jgi:propanediol dehydratase-reactivating factor large subunit
MPYIAGVDVGNNTTEVAVAEVGPGSDVRFLSSSIVRTVGIKGTLRNVPGIIDAIDQALAPLDIPRRELSLVLLNEATPVIGDVAMETITETVITESAMIGHNPDTPGGLGLGVGTTINIDNLSADRRDTDWIVVIPARVQFQEAAQRLNRAIVDDVRITGAIVQRDDGVLVHNRLDRPIPIIDEVQHIDRVPLNMPAAIEVAPVGKTIEKLSNPYDIATLFGLSADETRNVVPIARALTGVRSAVVIKTPRGDIQERRIPAGRLTLIGRSRKADVAVEEGADAIMNQVRAVTPLKRSGPNPAPMWAACSKRFARLWQT